MSSPISGDTPIADDGPAENFRRTGQTFLRRVASIMEAFNDTNQVLSLSALSERVGLPRSTVHRVADQLCGLGWIERKTGGYRIAIRLFELGSLALEGNRVYEVARPHVHALAAKTGFVVQLGVLEHAEVVYVERMNTGPLRLPSRIGGRKPAYCTALGKAMVAFNDASLHTVLSAPMPRRTGNTITDPDAYVSEVGQVRRAGIAFDRGEAYDGLGCVAAPIRNAGAPIGAVSVTGPLGQMKWAMAAEDVLNTAAAIFNASAKIGVLPGATAVDAPPHVR